MILWKFEVSRFSKNWKTVILILVLICWNTFPFSCLYIDLAMWCTEQQFEQFMWAIYELCHFSEHWIWILFFLKLNTFIQWNKWIHSYLSDKLLCLNMNSDINFIILISAFQLLTKIFLFRLFWIEWNGRFSVCVFYIILWKNMHLFNTKSTIFQHWSLFCMSQAFLPNFNLLKALKHIQSGFGQIWLICGLL